MKDSGLLTRTNELKELIAKYPDYPIAVLGGDCLNDGDYSWMYATSVRFGVGEILDYDQTVDEEIVFDDRGDFEERLENWLWCEVSSDISQEEFDELYKKELEKYEPYWKKCIFIYADN